MNNQSHATADDQPAAESRQKRTVDENSEEMKKDDDEQEEDEEEEIGLYIDKRKEKETANKRESRERKNFSN